MAAYPFRNAMIQHGVAPRTMELIKYLMDHDNSYSDRDTVAVTLGWIDHRLPFNTSKCEARITFAIHYCLADRYLRHFGFMIDRVISPPCPQRRETYRIVALSEKAA